MKKDVTVFIEHILASIDLIEKYIEGIDEKTFLDTPQIKMPS